MRIYQLLTFDALINYLLPDLKKNAISKTGEPSKILLHVSLFGLIVTFLNDSALLELDTIERLAKITPTRKFPRLQYNVFDAHIVLRCASYNLPFITFDFFFVPFL